VTAPIIVRDTINGIEMRQTTKDGYFDATAMCQAHGKRFNDWSRLDSSKEYLEALILTTGIPAVKLVVSLEGRYGGTWIHPVLANRVAQWCSPAFAVKVDQWIEELKQGRYPQARPNDPAILPILEQHTLQIQNIDGRLSAVEASPAFEQAPKREKRNRAHDRLLRAACRRTGGKCPCGCGRQMLNADGSFVDGVQIDHWNELRGDNRLANKWPLFQECHTEKHKRTQEFYLAFANFQRVLRRVEEDETAIVPPSPFAKRIIDEINLRRFGQPPPAPTAD